MDRITPFLWFDGNLGEALAHYTAIFPDSKVEHVAKGPNGKVVSATLRLEGQRLMALDGGPHYRFNEAISLFVSCETQAEIDALWAKLCEGGEPGRCGWLKDRFGLSWQIVPAGLGSWLGGADAEGARRARDAMLGMGKLDIERLRRAYHGD